MAVWTCSTRAGLALLTIPALQSLSSASSPDLSNIDCSGDYTDCWECLLKRWSPRKLQYCCEHAHRGCGPVTTSKPYDCQADYSDCWHCLLKRWSQGKIAWCCQHENMGCAPAEEPKQPPTHPPAAATTHMKADNAGKIAGGVLGGMAGAAALGLLGATIAEEHHVHTEHVVDHTKVVHQVHHNDHVASKIRADVVPAVAPLHTEPKSSSAGTPWWWWCLPLLLLPLLGLCIPALKSSFHKSDGKQTRKFKRESFDDAECSSQLPILDTESTSTSMGQFMSQQTSFSQAEFDDQRIVSAPLVGTITPPKIKAKLSQPRFVGYATPSQQLTPASSFVMEGASTTASVACTSSSVLASPATVVMTSGAVTPPTPNVLVGAAPMQSTQWVEVGTAPVPSSTGFVVRPK